MEELNLINEKLIVDIRNYVKLKTGIYYFKDIKTRNENLIVTCPFHKGGQEHRPSASIRVSDGEKASAGTFHCFTCGITFGLNDMMKELLGDLYDKDEVEERFNLSTLQARIHIIQDSKKTVTFNIPTRLTPMESELRVYRYYHDYLENRRISRDVADIYDIGFDTINEHITFPLRDINRNCLGIGRRSIKEKRYEYPRGLLKPLYGVYELPERVRYLWIVEGPFNLWSLRGWKKYGVALLGTGTKHQYDEILKIDCGGYVLALDPDDAGRNGIKKLIDFFVIHKKFNIYVALLPDGKDINDLTYDEFKNTKVVPYYEWLKIYK